MRIKGIGEAKAITIAAALKLGRRSEAISVMATPFVKEIKKIDNDLLSCTTITTKYLLLFP